MASTNKISFLPSFFNPEQVEKVYRVLYQQRAIAAEA
jgi:hypothetical protein